MKTKNTSGDSTVAAEVDSAPDKNVGNVSEMERLLIENGREDDLLLLNYLHNKQ